MTYHSQLFWDLLIDYTQKCSINGSNYVFEPNRHWTERVWWILAQLLAIYYCSRMIRDEYDQWQDTPGIVTFAQRATPVFDIPFPAVTICPQTKSHPLLLNYTRLAGMVRLGKWQALTDLE